MQPVEQRAFAVNYDRDQRQHLQNNRRDLFDPIGV